MKWGQMKFGDLSHSHSIVLSEVVTGATKLDHLEDAVTALSIELSSEDIDSLEEPYQPHRLRLSSLDALP